MSHLLKLLEQATEVREQTLGVHDLVHLETIASGFNSWLLDLPTPGPSPIWSNAMFECNVLAESSFFLAVRGFYEQASSVLRVILDSFLARLYWDIRREDGDIEDVFHGEAKSNEYADWELGLTRQYPGLRKEILPKLQEHRVIATYDSNFRIIETATRLLSELNLYVHNRPESRHYDGAVRSSTINVRYKDKHFDNWFGYLNSIHLLVGTFSILMYPKLVSFGVGKTLSETHSVEFESLTAFIEDMDH
jgi:hypothetical protein